MKHLKFALACLLSLALLLSCSALLAFAEEPDPAVSPVNWEDFYVTTQPQDLYVSHGESFTLSVEVNVPAGVDEVAYQWYVGYSVDSSGYQIPGATAKTLQLDHGDAEYPNASNSITAALSEPLEPGGSAVHKRRYYCVVHAYDYDADPYGEQLSSEHVYVRAEGSFGEKLYSLTVDPLESAILGMIAAPAALVAFAGNFGLLLLPIVLPFYMLYYMVREFGANFKGLFLF